MPNMTYYLEQGLLARSVGSGVYGFAFPNEVYVGLFTRTPSVWYDSVNNMRDGNELTATTAPGYTRRLVAWNTPAIDDNLSAASKITNSAEASLRWPASGNISGSNWGTITTIGIFDSDLSSGEPDGNLLWFGQLSSPVTLNVGDNFTLPAGSLSLTLR